MAVIHSKLIFLPRKHEEGEHSVLPILEWPFHAASEGPVGEVQRW